MNHTSWNQAMRVSVISVIINLLLSIFKLAAGILAHSGAMISDAVHSASDVFSTLIVMIGVTLAQKNPDTEHPYGHERLESAASLVLAVILALTGAAIGLQGLFRISAGARALPIPGPLALAAALISILVKEWMYWFTRSAALRLNSGALMADAWHHRSDALSSVGALIGIGFARIGFPLMDPLAALIISLMILGAAFSIFKTALDQMIDKACDQDLVLRMTQTALQRPGVQSVDLIRTRLLGSRIVVEIEIGADCGLCLTESHAIAQQVHDEIEQDFPLVKYCTVHVNPINL